MVLAANSAAGVMEEIRVGDLLFERVNTEVEAAFVWMTPELAAELLDRNRTNRGLSDGRVRLFAESILRREWELNGESVKITIHPDLIDGQHRLAAIVRAGIRVPVLLVWNLPFEVQETVDFTRARSLKDALRMRQIQNATNVAAAINALHAYRSGHFAFGGGRLSVKMGIRIWEEEPSIEESVKVGDRVKAGGLHVPGSILSAMHYVLSELDADDAEFFFERLRTGTHLDENSPIYKLRKRYEAEATAKRRMPKQEVCALLIKAWNLFRRGETVQLLIYRPGGRHPEPFPQPE